MSKFPKKPPPSRPTSKDGLIYSFVGILALFCTINNCRIEYNLDNHNNLANYVNKVGLTQHQIRNFINKKTHYEELCYKVSKLKDRDSYDVTFNSNGVLCSTWNYNRNWAYELLISEVEDLLAKEQEFQGRVKRENKKCNNNCNK